MIVSDSSDPCTLRVWVRTREDAGVLVSKVWVTLSRRSNGVGPIIRVVGSAHLAHLLVETAAVECDAAPEERGIDPMTGRVVWFSSSVGEGQVEGPFDVED